MTKSGSGALGQLASFSSDGSELVFLVRVRNRVRVRVRVHLGGGRVVRRDSPLAVSMVYRLEPQSGSGFRVRVRVRVRVRP